MARREEKKEKEMKSITIDKQKYFFLKLRWVDIAGLSTLEGDTEFNKLKCANIITEAYLYDVFATAPYLLQLLSLVEMGVTAVATWSYGRFWSSFSSDTALPLLILGMTLLASLMSLTQIWLVHILPVLAGSPLVQFGVVVVVKSVVNWTGMWNFMPDVVLATTSLKHASKKSPATPGVPSQVVPSGADSTTATTESLQERQSRNMQYGTLVACIDFGDQLGALVLGALVAALGVSRDNNWGHLEDLIQLCGFLGVCSAAFIFILK